MMNSQNISIFIVEDDVFFANLIKEHLEQNNYQSCKIFSTGEDFLNNLHHGPSVVILDFHLGGINGLDVLRKIKSVNPNIHVIFLSAQEEMDIAINSLKYGAFDYIKKSPDTMSRLVRLLERITQTNQIILKNTQLTSLRKWFFMAIAVLTCLFFIIN